MTKPMISLVVFLALQSFYVSGESAPTCAPDVCTTPSGPPPTVPIPFPNIGKSSDIPEMDAGSGIIALALVTGIVSLIRERRRK